MACASDSRFEQVRRINSRHATMSGTIMLNCWVIGTPTKWIFPIDIEPDKLWGHVKVKIKEKKKNEFADIDADTLDLWKVCRCAISHIVMLNSKG